LEIGFSMSTSEDPKSGSDAISAERVQGADLLGAARDGFVYRAQPDGRMALYKREKELTMKIRTPFSNSAEMKEIGRIFHLTAGLNRFRIDSELQPGAESSPPGEPERGDTMYLNLRSILQIMTFLSKGVRVPDEHNACGMAPVTPGPDGAPYDWTQVMDGNFAVSYQKHRPRDAEVAVQYRDYWFYIARDDVNSRAVLAVLEILFSLQDSDDKSSSPVLTLPAGR
jgi:hypothetical protein